MPAPIWNNRLHPFVSLPYLYLIAILPETASSLTATVQLERVMFGIPWISLSNQALSTYRNYTQATGKTFDAPTHTTFPLHRRSVYIPFQSNSNSVHKLSTVIKSWNERNHLDWMSYQKWLKANRTGSRIWEASSAVISIIRGNSFRGHITRSYSYPPVMQSEGALPCTLQPAGVLSWSIELVHNLKTV